MTGNTWMIRLPLIGIGELTERYGIQKKRLVFILYWLKDKTPKATSVNMLLENYQ